MGVLFAKTLSSILRPKFVFLYLITISLGVAASALLTKYFFGSFILEGQIITVSSLFLGISLLWTLGLPFVIWISCQGIGLIVREREEGTLLLLLSKPLSRNRIFLEKYLALVFSALLLGECSLLFSLTVITSLIFQDDQIAFNLLQMVPFLSIYLLFVTLCFSAVSAGLSVFSTGRKKPLSGLLIFAALVYLFLPAVRLGLEPQLFTRFEYLSFLDPGSHLASIMYCLLSMAQGIIFSPNLPLVLTVSPVMAAAFWLSACHLFLVFAFRKFNNLDISA